MNAKINSLILSSILTAAVIIVGTPLKASATDSSCLDGFTLVTTSEAATTDPKVPEIDNNADGWLCKKEITRTNGSKDFQFKDNAKSSIGSCPANFTRISWTAGAEPDRNNNGFVCKKDASSGNTITIDDSKPCGDACNPKIAFHSIRDGNYEIYKMNVDGSGQTRLTNNPSYDADPDWSPDGTKIAFVSDRDGNFEIYVMNADGSGQTRLTNNTILDNSPDWSPDGTKIAFYSVRDTQGDIYVMNADGSGEIDITNNPDKEDAAPSWSPDGTKIAFMSMVADRSFDIFVMNADGSGQINLTNHAYNDVSPDWGPGQNI